MIQDIEWNLGNESPLSDDLESLSGDFSNQEEVNL